MKKNIALLFGLVLSFGFVSCSSDDDENGEKYLAERVVTIYEWDGNQRPSEGKPYKVTRYNKDGQVVSIEDFYYGTREDYTYFENGDIKEKRECYKDGSVHTYKYEYSDGGASEVRYCYNWKDQLVSTLKLEYDNEKRPIKSLNIIDSIGNNYGYVTTYTYSGNERTIEITYLKDGSLFKKLTEEMDSHGYAIKAAYTTSPGTTYLYDFENEYDSEGKILAITQYKDSDRTNYIYTGYTYNDDGTVKNIQEINTWTTKVSDRIIDYKRQICDYEYTYTYKKK